jgi:hypothetical protein
MIKINKRRILAILSGALYLMMVVGFVTIDETRSENEYQVDTMNLRTKGRENKPALHRGILQPRYSTQELEDAMVYQYRWSSFIKCRSLQLFTDRDGYFLRMSSETEFKWMSITFLAAVTIMFLGALGFLAAK